MRRVLIATLSLLVVFGATACDIEIDELFDDIDLATSTDPEVRAAAEARREARNIAKARKARDKFLATGDREQLDEALKLSPKDPELLAFQLYLANDQGMGIVQVAAMAEAEAAKLKKADPDGKTPSEKDVQRAMSQDIVRAQARWLAGGASGPIPDPVPADKQQALKDYCWSVKKHAEKWGDQAFQFALDLEHGAPCG